MAYFYPIENQFCGVCNPRLYKIATSTAIEKGEIVKLTNGLVVSIGDQDQDDPYLGVAAEAHNGSTADGRQTGTEIYIYDNPAQVFATSPRKAITATGGSTATFVDSNLGPAVDDVWIGGKLWIVNHQGNSAYNNTKHTITDYAQSGGTITIGTTLATALASGDTAYICPGKVGMRGQYGFDLNSDGTDIDWETTGGESLIIDGADPESFLVKVRLRLHLLGNHVVAL